jgi:ABC-3C biological conflict system middle component
MLRAMAQMSQLVFQPAFDSFHAVFRFLRLSPIVKEVGSLLVDHIRILDFYLLFPFRIRSIRLAPGHQHYKRLSEKYANLTPYGEQPDAPLLFDRMRPIQLAALETMASQNYIDDASFLMESVRVTEKILPKDISSRIAELNQAQSDLLQFLQILAEDYSLSGPNGLKARTELMEYRYDAI